MVSPEVYETFLANIRERESRGEAAEVRFIHVAPPTFESAVVSGDEAEITLQLTAELFNIAHGGPGAAPPRNSPGIVKTTDWWTFAKKLSAPSPAWTLVATAESASDLTTGTKA